MSEQPAEAPRAALEIRYNSHGNALMALCFAALAAISGSGLIYAFVHGIRADRTGQALFLAGVFVALLAAAIYNAALLFDDRTVVTLSPEGLRDRRAGGVLIPWAKVARLRKVYGPDSEGIVRFELTEDPGPSMHYDPMSSSGRLAAPFLFDGRQINVQTASLDISQDDFIKATLDFAPHIVTGPPL
jgi:hypothetical protein